MRLIRLVSWTVVSGMLVAIGYGLSRGSLGVDFDIVWSRPWGIVALIDLYAGLILFGVWIWFREQGRRSVWAWWLGLMILGNLAAGVYVVAAASRSADVSALLIGSRSRSS